MYILDTDTLTHLQKKSNKVLERLEKAEKLDVISITIITRGEILRGRIEFLFKANDKDSLEKAQRLFVDSEQFLIQFPVIGFDKNSLANFEKFRQHSKFRKISRADMLIASICLANRAILVTRNIEDFKEFPNLEVENWVD